MDDRPIISGRHALHLYHGYLGAQALRAHGSSLCFDPANYAGYPKTPWLDAGSRPAEAAIFVGTSSLLVPHQPADSTHEARHKQAACAYKVGVALSWWLLPLFPFLSTVVLRWGLPTRCGAAWAGMALCWSDFGRGLLFAGEMDLLLAAGLAVLQLASLVRYTTRPSAAAGLFMAANGWALVFLQPLLAGVPPVLCLLLGIRNAGKRGLTWHLGLALSATAAIAGNGWWLAELARFWWIQADIPGCPSLATVFARILGKWGLFTVLLAATLPVAHAAALLFNQCTKAGGWVRVLAAGAMPGAMSLWLGWQGSCEALPLGLADDVAAEIASASQRTTLEARILWEENEDTDAWTPLLPLLTHRSFVGGLGRPAAIEHAASRLREGFLAGRPLSAWTDLELDDYCRRYNIGWITCRSRAATERFSHWSAAESMSLLPNGDAWFAISRQPTFFLVGQGKVARCDTHALTLTDVEPANGQIVLSFHTPPHVWAASQWARVEKQPQVHDAIPLLRVRLTEPMTRLTLYWDGE
jgi:hypothetical protein